MAPRPLPDRLYGYRFHSDKLLHCPAHDRDIDIVVELSERDLSRFIPLFEADYYLDPETVRDAGKDM